MIRVVIESPYAGEVERNVAYARECTRRALSHGWAPFVSHLLYTQPGVLDDLVPEQRARGIEAGLTYHDVADRIIFCLRYGWSEGMKAAFFHAVDDGHRHAMGFWDCVGAYHLSRVKNGWLESYVVSSTGVSLLRTPAP